MRSGRLIHGIKLICLMLVCLSPLAAMVFAGPKPIAQIHDSSSGTGSGYSAQVLSLWPVNGATSGATVKLWAQVGNISLYALPSNATVWFWVTGPNWGGTHWVGFASTAGLSPGIEKWYFLDWSIPANAPQGDYTYWAQVWTSIDISDWSKGQGFALTNGITPGKATLLLPNGITPSNMPTYTWTAVNTSTWYYLWVNDKTNSPKIQKWYTAEQAKCAAGTGICSATPGIALPEGSAQWWIQTWNDAGYGPWSDGVMFTMTGGLVAYYPFRGNANDESGRGNHGVVHGATLTADRLGNPNRAYEFNGTSDYIEALNPLPDMLSASVSFWVYINVFNSQRSMVFFEGDDTGGHDFYFAFWSGNRSGFVLKNNAYLPVPDSSLATGKWLHIVCISNNESRNMQIWLNGNKIAESSTEAIANAGYHEKLQLGRLAGGPMFPGSEYFSGKLSDIGFYNRALSESEIKYLYEVGSSSSGTGHQ